MKSSLKLSKGNNFGITQRCGLSRKSCVNSTRMVGILPEYSDYSGTYRAKPRPQKHLNTACAFSFSLITSAVAAVIYATVSITKNYEYLT